MMASPLCTAVNFVDGPIYEEDHTLKWFTYECSFQIVVAGNVYLANWGIF